MATADLLKHHEEAVPHWDLKLEASQPEAIQLAEVEATSPLRPIRYFFGGWAASLAVHSLLVLALAVIYQAAVHRGSIALVYLPSNDQLEMMDELVLTLPLMDFSTQNFESAEADQRLEELMRESDEAVVFEIEPVQGVDWLNTPGLLDPSWFGELTPAGERAAEATGAVTFLQAHATGSSFVYVVDRSGSMMGPRWEEARAELIRSLRSLRPDQKFFVILFNHDQHLMLDLRPQRAKLVEASPENVEQIEQWLMAQQPFGYTRPKTSTQTALSMNPDVIFLMSDGEIQDDTQTMLRRRNRLRITPSGARIGSQIHTIAFKSREGAPLLQQIASENQGTFQFVP